MLKLVLVGFIIVVACAKAEPWPDTITVDFRGVHWISANGTQRFFENENALSVTGMIHSVKSVNCELESNFVCSFFIPQCDDDGHCIEPMEVPDVCIVLKCVAVPHSDKIQITHKEIHVVPRDPGVAMAFGMLSAIGDHEVDVIGGAFHPEDIELDVRAIDSLSMLWNL